MNDQQGSASNDIFAGVRALNIPTTEFVVVGGGLLVALSMIPWDDDIDICVSPKQFRHFQAAGWTIAKFGEKNVLKHSIYDVGTEFGDWPLVELQSDALSIQGIPFINPQKLLAWKRQMNRPKDELHIALLEEYLSR